MSAPSPAETALRDELAASIEATLRREGRRNEARLAMVRVAALVGLAGSELWFWATAPEVPFGYRIPTFVYVLFSVVLYAALRNGWYRPWISALMPALDGLFILARAQLTFSFHPIEGLEQSMELATVALGGALLIISGGFRLSLTSLATATVTGLLLYVWFAVQTRIEGGQIAVHGVVLLGIAGATWLLTNQVRRAVRSEVARVTLARFLPAALLDGVADDPIALVTRPRAVRATVLVSDIRGFTAWAEHRSPIEVLSALNVVQGRLAAIVRQHHGMVDKFMGDGMLAVFGTPEPLDDHADHAIAAALEMQQAVLELSETGEIGFRIGIGVHTGELVVGCLGSGVRMEFTVLGDTVNTASRLEALTKVEKVSVLISGDTVAADGDHGLVRHGQVSLRGRAESLDVWTLPPSDDDAVNS